MNAPPSPRDPLGIIGTVIGGKYLVQSVIGEGGAAVVYKGEQQGWNVPVAIKLITSLATTNELERPALFEEFRREGKLISELSTRSAAIVQPRDLGIFERPGHAPIPYLVLEWLDGKTLDEVIVGETNGGVAPRDLAGTMKLLDPIARALAIAHGASVVHRDVKPENIIVLDGAAKGEVMVKLLDFGIAKVMQRRLEGVHQTGTMPTAFTPHYGAPEQFSKTFGETGPWTDVFAMALVLVEVMRGGRRAFRGEDFSDLARESMDPAHRPSPRALKLAVNDDVEAVFLRALAVKTEHRYGSMGDFWGALVAAASPSSGSWALGPLSANRRSLPSVSPSSGPNSQIPSAPGSGPPTTGAPPSTALVSTPPAGGSRTIVFGAAALGALLIAGASVVAAKKLVRPDVVASASATEAAASPAPPASGSSAAPSASALVGPTSLCPAGQVVVPGGKFRMGSGSPGSRDDGPEHTVFIDTFCLDLTEVTVARYDKCVSAGVCAKPEAPTEDAERCNFGRDDAATQPINCVTFDDAAKLCGYEARRLPTEAEWEMAASGGNTALPWGDALDPDRANLDAKDAFDGTAPVGSFPAGASHEGVLDLVGNVAEWTSDWMAPYDDGQEINPRGPESGAVRVVRGGAWSGERAPSKGLPLGKLLTRHREGVAPSTRSAALGFRCASNLKR